MKTLHTILVLFLLTLSISNAQTKVGVLFIVEDANDSQNLRPGVGLVIDHKLTRKSGIESGVFYRTFKDRSFFNIVPPSGGNLFLFSEIRESYITVPILYKFHTRIVNVSLGPTFDFFLGWKQTGGSPDLEVNDFSIDPTFSIGGILKMSKNIRLSESLHLEPDMRINPLFGTNRIYGGFGLAIKYQTN